MLKVAKEKKVKEECRQQHFSERLYLTRVFLVSISYLKYNQFRQPSLRVRKFFKLYVALSQCCFNETVFERGNYSFFTTAFAFPLFVLVHKNCKYSWTDQFWIIRYNKSLTASLSPNMKKPPAAVVFSFCFNYVSLNVVSDIAKLPWCVTFCGFPKYLADQSLK